MRDRVSETLGRAAEWIWSMQADGQPRGVFRASAEHDLRSWPSVLLNGTYDAVMALALLGEIDRLSNGERRAVADFILGFRREDGVFANPQMSPEDTFKKEDAEETRRYIDFHLTNYSLGALEALDALDEITLDFVDPFLDPQYLEAWLARRDLRDPWQEGNNIVNLASFLLLLRDRGSMEARLRAEHALEPLVDWHLRLQEPATGFWGVGQTQSETAMLYAMAGATHNFHLFYALGRPIPYGEAIVDSCLKLPAEVTSACIDVDAVDILANFHRLQDYRRGAIEAWLAHMLGALLHVQNPDGGFADVRVGTRRLDGWVRGYEEPQGISNGFATWFRCIAIAMIAHVLWPDWRSWGFRRMIGIGYFAPQDGTTE